MKRRRLFPGLLVLLLIVLLVTLSSCSISAVAPSNPTSAPLLSGLRPTTDSPSLSTHSALPTQPSTPTDQSSQLLLTPTPLSQPTPMPLPTLRALTSGGCCVQPFWSPDGEQVLFLDRLSTNAPTGIWSVDLQSDPPQLFTERLGIFSNDMKLRAFLQNRQTVVERLADGQRWLIPNGGRAVSFSPDDQMVAWVSGNPGPPYDTARRDIWISAVDGSQPRRLLSLVGGGLNGWFPDGRLLINGRLDTEQEGQALWALSTAPEPSGKPQMVELARDQRIRSATLSPVGNWLAYVAAFSGQPDQDGLWLVNTFTLEKRRLDIFGAFRWRDDERLLVVPMDLSQPVHSIWQVMAESGQAEALTDPAQTPIRLSNGDWSVDPLGKYVIFVSAMDHNIWLLTLP
jgi:Tol biopolymer transport system component